MWQRPLRFVMPCSSRPDLIRGPSTPCFLIRRKKDMDARDKRGMTRFEWMAVNR
jgi:hypothetical protein